ncbi:hypothetical protein CS063_04915 [Sporanaerobium hydrogeniformans]|uniref:Uncharacterized protein n=1 Tax=Sporanaerobium hydrogeniformans TaxID=3072179 RepID=A0AC61DFP2_9FIRM|nr:nucleoside-triphosphatase [Sporanaerobium hydrogeniformans]PHV71392.1 hypothetical protein CS063_04915 [Sporanaerobium hydrogeniformans]
MIKNIFITGEKQIGKSTLINKLIKEMKFQVSGFQTLPYEIENQRMGFYLKGRVETKEYRNGMPISIQTSETNCMPVTETFESLGVEVLRKSLEDSGSIILMDELGRLERMATRFNHQVWQVLDSNKLVLGVLQQVQVPLLEAIKKRQDTLILILNHQNALDVHIKIKEEVERILNNV